MNEELKDMIREVSDESLDRSKLIKSIQDVESVALMLESFPIDERLEIWAEIEPERRLSVLLNLRHDPRETIIDSMSLEELDALFDDMYADELIELSETLPDRLIGRALKCMDEQQIRYFELAKEYDEDETGHWVNHKLLMLPATAKVQDCLRLLRREVPRYTEAVFLTNRIGHYQGAVLINDIIGLPNHIPLSDLIEEDFPIIDAEEDVFESSRKLQASGYSSLPVVDNEKELVGRLDMMTANDVVREEFESQLMASAGMDEQEDLFSPVKKSIKGRSIWLGINLLTALLASWFIGLFEATLASVVALAVLMPVVASMGGIAGSQTLALLIRGLALGQVNETNSKLLLNKELKVGALSGLIWSVVIAIVAAYWFDNILIALVIALAILLNIITASVAGLFVPIVLKKMGYDPALSGAVILTTITDIVGFVVFLGLGTLLLL
jgi:magnesium transporter